MSNQVANLHSWCMVSIPASAQAAQTDRHSCKERLGKNLQLTIWPSRTLALAATFPQPSIHMSALDALSWWWWIEYERMHNSWCEWGAVHLWGLSKAPALEGDVIDSIVLTEWKIICFLIRCSWVCIYVLEIKTVAETMLPQKYPLCKQMKTAWNGKMWF